MTSRTPPFLAAALVSCLWQTGPASAADPPAPLGLAAEPLPAAFNQQIANTIAANLRQSGVLRRFTIDISFRDGVAELTGAVASQAQREEARRIVQGVPGVDRVLDGMTLASTIQPVQAEAPKQPDPLARPKATEKQNGQNGDNGENGQNGKNGQNGAPEEPQPEFSAPQPQPYDLNPPRMPPYAWPTYAPYNNYSRVGYPQAYPYNAWPYIGPIYPFPKVPLGWRAVTLQWDDGYWWFSRTATKYDWWKLRYW